MGLLELIDSFPAAFMLPLLMLSLAPFVPEPHLWEKTKMLVNGTLTKPIDIFDFFMHGIPAVVVVIKTVRGAGIF